MRPINLYLPRNNAQRGERKGLYTYQYIYLCTYVCMQHVYKERNGVVVIYLAFESCDNLISGTHTTPLDERRAKSGECQSFFFVNPIAKLIAPPTHVVTSSLSSYFIIIFTCFLYLLSIFFLIISMQYSFHP